ncbi:MAG TPA: methyltransferase domain-containing protein [Planctomycetaceae bacterium]|nr:methyltransferase domain-containing protein [Planctomycetaceae bacterium]
MFLRRIGASLGLLCGFAFVSVALIQGRAGASDPADVTESARRILELSGARGGFAVHLGSGDGRLTAALGADERFVVHGLDADPTNVERARKHIQSRGLYGPVSVDRVYGERLPYVDNLVRLLVVEDAGAVTRQEMTRVLAPGGVALIRQGGHWQRMDKPYPSEIDQWTHYLHDASNNAVASDLQVGPPKRVRWIAGPLWGRSHEFNPSLNALVAGGGRIFYFFDEGVPGVTDLRFPSRWGIYARDAFSGVLLWRRPLRGWGYRQWNTRGMWSAPLTLNRRMVTDGRRVYVTLGYKAPVSVLDAATGETLRVIDDSLGTDEMVLSDGVLVLCVREQLSVASPPKGKPKRRLNPQEWSIGAPGPASLRAVEAESGRTLWKRPPQPMTVLTLAACGGRVCFHSTDQIVCVDLRTGNRVWSTPCRPLRGSRHSGGTLVMYDGVVLFAGAEGLEALSAKDGQRLWVSPRVAGPAVTHPPDLFVADGLVWGGDEPKTHFRERTTVRREGRDPHTGEVKRVVEVSHLISPLHHFRCYRSKATDRYLLLTKRGVEFLDLVDGDHMRNDWLRAMCHYGFMPCYGLLYMPPHHCFCYPGVRLDGFLALAAGLEEAQPAAGSPAQPAAGSAPDRLERGPAYQKPSTLDPQPSTLRDWPAYRHDALKSGHTPMPLAADLAQAWRVHLGGRLTQPVVAGDRLLVAQRDAHQLHCLDPATGESRWTFTAGGRIDSPPTVHNDTVLFGCRDGWVYSLRAADGQLAWRFRAAPEDRRIVAFGQPESVWPVSGSVLVLDGVAYVCAGRSSFLDGGLYLYGLDPRSGEVVCQTCVSGPWPDVHKQPGRPFDMDGCKADLLVTDGQYIYLFQKAFDKQLRDVTPPRATSLGARKLGRRLIATNGFLQDFWYNRTYWTYSDTWPGFYFATAASKTGQILVFDRSTTYAVHVFTKRLRLSPEFVPGSQSIQLVADDNANDPVLEPKVADREKGPGFSRAAPPKWSSTIPLRVTAMVSAGDKIFLAGPPDVVPEDDPLASFDGRLGARLRVVAKHTGQQLREYELEELPVFDGMCAAAERLYLATANGSLLCFAPR